jgi:hypothetical protein
MTDFKKDFKEHLIKMRGILLLEKVELINRLNYLSNKIKEIDKQIMEVEENERRETNQL